MSFVGFEVHVDKENDVPSINKRGALKHVGLNGDRGKLQQTVTRKALLNVINEPANLASRGLGGKQLSLAKDGISNSVKSSSKILSGAENRPVNTDNKKQHCHKTPSLQGVKVSDNAGSHSSKVKSVEAPKKLQAPLKPLSVVNDDDYDSDSIFPTSERLSSYVSKLLTWRPPCLFGALPNSESDNSDLEELPEDDILLDMPLPISTVPDFSTADLVHFMTEFPPTKPECLDKEQGHDGQDKDIEVSLDLTSDASFSFGTLHFMNGSLDSSHISDANASTHYGTNAS
uniref:Uncharacterized protein n=1 Tax=Arion vulgaris TaxID=1028688 RepID=A0A0B6ZM26_9EUPU